MEWSFLYVSDGWASSKSQCRSNTEKMAFSCIMAKGAPTQRWRPAPKGIHVHGLARSSARGSMYRPGTKASASGKSSSIRFDTAGLAPTSLPAAMWKPPTSRSSLATRSTRMSGGCRRSASLMADSSRGMSRSAW